MVYDGGVNDQEGSSSASPASAAAAAAAIARAGRPPRPGSDKSLGVRHPLKHRRFRAGGTEVMVEAGGASSSGQAVAEARDVGEATAVAAATATAVGAPKESEGESERVDEVGYMCGGWKR